MSQIYNPDAVPNFIRTLKPWDDPDTAKTLIEQTQDETKLMVTPCPRCGMKRMNPAKVRNALSRYAHVYICPECGTDEALRDMRNLALPLNCWWIIDRWKGLFAPDKEGGGIV